jgi:hypothetical protein
MWFMICDGKTQFDVESSCTNFPLAVMESLSPILPARIIKSNNIEGVDFPIARFHEDWVTDHGIEADQRDARVTIKPFHAFGVTVVIYHGTVNYIIIADIVREATIYVPPKWKH